jgi:hypothetical protein
MRNRNTHGKCAICGESRDLTSDHVPPKGIFPEPRSSDLITVRACSECNNGASAFDERFRVYLSLHAGIDQPETERLFMNHTLPTIRHNRRIRREIISNSEPVERYTPAGIYLGNAHTLDWDSEAHDKVVERTARGLYFHEYGEPLGKDVEVYVRWFKELPPRLVAIMSNFPLKSIANGAFVYQHVRAEDVEPRFSHWVFQFFDRHWAGATTAPIGSQFARDTKR